MKKLIDVIQWRELAELVKEVRNERMTNKTCVSAQLGVSVPEVLYQIINTNYFQDDYESVTEVLLNEKLNYKTAILALKQIADDSLFENN